MALAAFCLSALACSSTKIDDDGSDSRVDSDSDLTAACSFDVTKNTYDGDKWWGNLTVRNTSGAKVKGLTIALDVPDGVDCDYDPPGWTKSQAGNTCTFKKEGAALAAGRAVTLGYSTNSQELTGAANVRVSGSNCNAPREAAPDPGDQAGAPGKPGKPGKPGNSGNPSAPPRQAGNGNGTWRTANLTNYESYPAPGSNECGYSGCKWSGRFAALESKMPETWVESNNIISVHSKDYEKYKLKTFRIRQGANQVEAIVYDMCKDEDCHVNDPNCCTNNSKETGFLIDMEKYTVERFGPSDGVVEWMCLDCD